MAPFICAGDIVVARPRPGEELKVGDIVLYEMARQPLLHRVIQKSVHKGNTWYMTKGDSAYGPDGFIRPDQIMGKIMVIEKADFTIRMDHYPIKVINRLFALFSRYGSRSLPLLNQVTRVENAIMLIMKKVTVFSCFFFRVPKREDT